MLLTLRLTRLLISIGLLAGLATMASATVHPLSGNARFQIGDGLPIPGTLYLAAPEGKIEVAAGAVVNQTGSDPMPLKVPEGSLEWTPVPFIVPVASNNSAVFFQVLTSIGVTIPYASSPTLSAGKRTGAATVSYCPGQTVTPTGNPGCASGVAAAHGSVKGIMIYTATGAQFGGPMGVRMYGRSDLAINVLMTPFTMCNNCIAFMALASPNSTSNGGIGHAFIAGSSGATTPGAAPIPGRLTVTGVTGFGAITAAMITPNSSPGLPNPGTSFGGPWTTGRLELSAPLALGMAEIFTLTGSDARVSGVGSISLVGGSLSNRAITGPNANRGWLNLTIGPALGALPSMGGLGTTALVVLISLAGGYTARKRSIRSRRSDGGSPTP